MHKVSFEESLNIENIDLIYNSNSIINTDGLRIYPIKQSELFREGIEKDDNKILEGTYTGSKWGGKYLRAPDIYFTILEKGKGKLIPLKEVAEVRRGFTTGANDFFYVQPTGKPAPKGLLHVKNGAGWEGFIEEEFLEPIIFSLREVETYKIDKNMLKKRVIICESSIDDLKNTNLLKYIKYGEQKWFHKRPTCRSRKTWYILAKNRKYAPLIFFSKIGERMPIALNKNIYEDKKQYGIIPKREEDILSLAGILNSTITRLFVELSSRQLTGAQAIADIDVDVVGDLLIPDIFYNSSITKKISKLFKIMSEKKSNSIFIECGIPLKKSIQNKKPRPLSERLYLDSIIFDLLGLEDFEIEEVYLSVCNIVFNRLIKAKS
jgi:hypothetical protein